MTGICVTYNTKALFMRAYASVRRFHPGLSLFIVDGSDPGSECYNYVSSLAGPLVQIYQPGINIGHGKGMDYALRKIDTGTALVFDSDIVMLRSPLAEMLRLLDIDAYGVGWLTQVGADGFDFGTPGHGHELQQPITYLHPYFMLLNVAQYKRYQPFVHHGAPCYKAMLDLHRKGLSEKMLRHWPGLTGHTSGQGINWQSKPNNYIQHDFGGTRNANKVAGKKEITGLWEH